MKVAAMAKVAANDRRVTISDCAEIGVGLKLARIIVDGETDRAIAWVGQASKDINLKVCIS